jgi:RNA polymerase sigma factor (sigma-70 family)
VKQKTPAVVAEYKKLSDEELVYRFVHRHENIAFDFLFDRYGHLVLGICMRFFSTVTAKEKTEDYFAVLMEDLKKFHIDDNFKLWLYNYINKKCIAESKNMPIKANNIIEPGGMSFSASTATGNALQLMEQSLSNLKKIERECIEAFYLNDKNYRQIAIEKNLTIEKIKQYIQSGLQTINCKSEALRYVKP